MLLAVQDLILVRIRIGGVHPFLLPALAVIPVTLERSGQSLLYALFFGLACDLLMPTGVFVCFYCLVFLAAAVIAQLLSGQVIVAGFSARWQRTPWACCCAGFADPAADVPAEHLHRSGADADGQGAAAVAGGHAAGTYLVLQGVPPDAERMTKRSFP